MEKLKDYLKQITDLQYITNLLDWDLKVSIPKDSIDYVIDLKSKIELKVFEMTTSNTYGTYLKEVIDSDYFKSLEVYHQKYIKSLYIEYLNNKKIPNDFYEEYISLCTKTNVIWKEAKEKNDYLMYKPYLEKIVNMTKKYYEYIDNTKNVYDVMLEQYEIGMTSNIIDSLFNDIKKELIPIVKEYKDNQYRNDYLNDYSDSELLECARVILEYMGFDFNKGSLGIYPHGFMTRIGFDDIRIAFKNTKNPISFVSTIVHEGGHSLFEQNIRKELLEYDNCTVRRLYALHESQSRFYENILGRNINFWAPIYDKVKSILRLNLSLDEFIIELNKVDCGLIRTDADELTYCLHIIIRYEIEKELFSGSVTVDELPSLWNKKMKDYLGVDVLKDSDGLMQDVHWSEGSFGYFPSYLIGNVYDGMFIKYITDRLGNIDDILKAGRIKDITNLLAEEIYQYGGAFNSNEIFNRLCNEDVSAKYIIKYYKEKYKK